MDIFDYWMEQRKARASNSWRDTEVHAVNVQRVNVQGIVDIIEDTIQRYFGRRINHSTLSQIQFDLVAKGLDRNMAQRVIEVIRDAPPADWDLEALAEALAHDYDGDTISAASYCPRIMVSEKGPIIR